MYRCSTIIIELLINFKYYSICVNCSLCKLIGQEHYINDIDSEIKYVIY